MPAQHPAAPGNATAHLLQRCFDNAAGIAIRAWCWKTVRNTLHVTIEGQHNIPKAGAVLLVCRHYHHYYDGCLLLAIPRRPVHLIVALDWVRGRIGRRVMEGACRAARWPVVLRSERLSPNGSAAGAYAAAEAGQYLRRALKDCNALLRAGEVVAIFPEGYPTIDPGYTPKRHDSDFLPFRGGFGQLALAAQRDNRTRVAIVPVGLHYPAGRRHTVAVRFAAPHYLAQKADRRQVTLLVEEEVRRLSGL